MSGDGYGVWSGVVLTPDEQAALDQHRAVMRDLRVGRRIAKTPPACGGPSGKHQGRAVAPPERESGPEAG